MLLQGSDPTPEEAGTASKETEAANKEAEKLQTVPRKRKQYSTSQIINWILPKNRK